MKRWEEKGAFRQGELDMDFIEEGMDKITEYLYDSDVPSVKYDIVIQKTFVSFKKMYYDGVDRGIKPHDLMEDILYFHFRTIDNIAVEEVVGKSRRPSIPQKTKDKVWNRDGGKCVQCGSNENIEFDHIIPFSKGGSSTYRNLQILCEKCNRVKSANIG
tara:strand:- start:559 stop:1035 length:477 start_codon:yes stop_codon:yes gene_type:complete